MGEMQGISRGQRGDVGVDSWMLYETIPSGGARVGRVVDKVMAEELFLGMRTGLGEALV